jgi:hypothetical protein
MVSTFASSDFTKFPSKNAGIKRNSLASRLVKLNGPTDAVRDAVAFLFAGTTITCISTGYWFAEAMVRDAAGAETVCFRFRGRVLHY